MPGLRPPGVWQIRILAKHFLVRMLGRDTTAFQDERVESIVFGSVFYAGLTFAMSYIFLKPYVLKMVRYNPTTIWMEEIAYLTLIMAMMGIVCAFTWESLFVDRLDFENLGFLPLSPSGLFLAKFTGMWVLVAGLSLLSNNPLTAIYFGPSWLVVVFLAVLFTFLLVVAVQAFLVVILGLPLFRRAAHLFQFVLLGGFVTVFFWFPGFYRQLPDLAARWDPGLYWFPPFWFVGLNQWMRGNGGDLFAAAGGLALMALLVLNLGYLGSLPLILARDTGGSGWTGRTRRPDRFTGLHRFFQRVFLRHSVQRAVYYYFKQTLTRDHMAKVRLAVFMALPVGYAVTRLTHTTIGQGIAGLSDLQGPLLGLPVYLLLFLLGGVRVVVTHPVALKANWIFALTDRVSPRHYQSGLRRAIALTVLVPGVLGLFAIYLVFWPWWEAAGHALFSLILGLVLLEGLYAGYRKVPFTVEPLPGKLKLKNYWPVYLIAYVVYVSSARALAHFLLVHPEFYPLLAAGAAGLTAAGRLLRQRLAGNSRMQYEDRASPYLLTLKLDN